MQALAASQPGTISGRMFQCGPCHSVHMSDGGGRPAGTPSARTVEIKACEACHSTQGGATPVYFPNHITPLQNVAEPGDPGFLPLVNDDGEIGRSGRIACITCHMPHGRPPGPGFPAIDPRKVTHDQLRAMMPMVAPYVAPNLCSSCHGFEGIVRFLYFHNPEKRRAMAE
ncbi:MAG: hypothetical protein HY718_04580, partial [Planctomycetes bacterium]|nr:hypothetical protein [Planctomycetota bacterium]